MGNVSSRRSSKALQASNDLQALQALQGRRSGLVMVEKSNERDMLRSAFYWHQADGSWTAWC